VFRVGSRKSATGSSQPSVHHDPARGPAAERRNTRRASAVRAMLDSVSTVPATVIGISENGDSNTAAIGG